MTRTAVLGAARGLVATLAMSVPMLIAGRTGRYGTQPPKRIKVEAMEADGAPPVTEAGRNLASTLAHLCFGAIAGAGFALVRARFRPPGPVVAQGLAYGLMVWAVSYKGWVPALDIMPPPQDDFPVRQRANIGAHLVYGGVLGVLNGSGGRTRQGRLRSATLQGRSVSAVGRTKG